MRKLLLASAALVVMSAPSFAASSLGFGGNFNFGNTQTNAASLGSAAAGALRDSNNTSLGAGIAAQTPAGSTSAGLGASAGSTAQRRVRSLGNGAGPTRSAVGGGAGIGIGVTNPKY
jgi:hypothetical protein